MKGLLCPYALTIHRKRNTMTQKRKIIVNILALIAFIFLFLLPILAFTSTSTQAGATQSTATAYSGDYVFFVVEDNDVPLAAAPVTDVTDMSSYIVWISLASLAVMIIFTYSAWYMNIRKILTELSYKLSPNERSSFIVPQGYLHPIRSYQLAKEAENSVASMYVRAI